VEVVKRTLIIILSLLVLMMVIAGCSQAENSKILKPFEEIAADQVKRIEFIDAKITSDTKEIGRAKMIDKPQDIEKVVNYLKSINLYEYHKEIKNPEFIIELIDSTDNSKHCITSICVSKNSMFFYENELKYGAKFADNDVFKEIKKLYNEADYDEELLYKK
jgi:hypothetical protein